MKKMENKIEVYEQKTLKASEQPGIPPRPKRKRVVLDPKNITVQNLMEILETIMQVADGGKLWKGHELSLTIKSHCQNLMQDLAGTRYDAVSEEELSKVRPTYSGDTIDRNPITGNEMLRIDSK